MSESISQSQSGNEPNPNIKSARFSSSQEYFEIWRWKGGQHTNLDHPLRYPLRLSNLMHHCFSNLPRILPTQLDSISQNGEKEGNERERERELTLVWRDHWDKWPSPVVSSSGSQCPFESAAKSWGVKLGISSIGERVKWIWSVGAAVTRDRALEARKRMLGTSIVD